MRALDKYVVRLHIPNTLDLEREVNEELRRREEGLTFEDMILEAMDAPRFPMEIELNG